MKSYTKKTTFSFTVRQIPGEGGIAYRLQKLFILHLLHVCQLAAVGGLVRRRSSVNFHLIVVFIWTKTSCPITFITRVGRASTKHCVQSAHRGINRRPLLNFFKTEIRLATKVEATRRF